MVNLLKVIKIAFCIMLIFACNTNPTQKKTKQKEVNASKKAIPAKQQATINWLSLAQMESAMKAIPKDIMVMVYATWCEESKRYEATTYQAPKIVQYINKHYYAVKVNAEEAKTLTYRGKQYNIHPNTGHNEIVYELKAGSIPCLVFLDENFELQGHKMGFTNMQDLDELLFTYNN